MIFADPLFGEPRPTSRRPPSSGGAPRRIDDHAGIIWPRLLSRRSRATADEARAIKALFPDAALLTGSRARQVDASARRGAAHAAHRVAWVFPARTRASRREQPAAALGPGARRREPAAATRSDERHPDRARGVEPEPVGHQAGDAVGVRHRRRRGAQRRRRLRTAARLRAGRRRNAGHEPVAGQRLDRARDDGRLLHRPARRPRPRRRAAPGEAGDAEDDRRGSIRSTGRASSSRASGRI